MATTQKEIAEMLGLSVMTVSLALRDSSKVKKETREKIVKLANSINYSPSEIARSLVTGKSYTVGITLPGFSQTFYSERAEEIQKELNKKGYSGFALCGDTEDAWEKIIETFIRKKADDIIAFNRSNYKSRFRLKEVGIPIVLSEYPVDLIDSWDRGRNNEEVNYVTCDKYQGGRIVMEHLVGLGYRKIGFICRSRGNEERFAAYKDILLEHRLPFNREWVSDGGGFYANGYNGMKQLLALSEKPEAVFAKNDVAAIGAMRAVKDAGLDVPGDVAVVGFDNIKEGEYSLVSLTTVDQKKEEIAQKLTEIILKKIENKEDKNSYHMMIKPELVIRESCGYKLKNAVETTHLENLSRKSLE